MILFLLTFAIAQAEQPIVQWAKSFGGIYLDKPTSTAFDSKGNSYVIGNFLSPTITIGTDTFINGNLSRMFIVKYNKTGNILWTKSIAGSNMVNSIAVDHSDNVYVGGYFNDSFVFGKSKLTNDLPNGSINPFIAKYDPNGTEMWARGCTNACKPTEMDGQIFSICVDKDNHIHALGNYQGCITFDTFTLTSSNSKYPIMFLADFDSNGKTLWVKDAQSNGYGYCTPTSIAVDFEGNSFVTGQFSTDSLVIGSTTLKNSNLTTYSFDIFIAKYDTTGTSVWAKSAQCKGTDMSSTLSVDKSGNVYIGGTFGSNQGFQITKFDSIKFDSITLIPSSIYNNLFLTKYNGNGNVLWAKTVQGSPSSDTGINSIFIDTEKNIYSTGYYNSAITFDSISLSNPTNGQDIFVTKSDSLGNVIWAKSYGGDLDDSGMAISGDNKGNLMLTGYFYSPNLRFDKDSLSTIGNADIFVAKIQFDSIHIKITGDTTICHGSLVTLIAHGADSYQWSDGSTAESLQITSGQRIWVIGSSASGCTSDTLFQKITDITPSVTITGDTTYCPGYSITLKAHGASNYLWNGTTPGDSIQVRTATSGWVVGYSAGCISDTVTYRVHQEPDWSFNCVGDTLFCAGGSTVLKASGADSRVWSTGETTSSITISKPGKYYVTGMNKRGCEKTDTVNITEILLPTLDFSLSDTTVDTRHNKITCEVSAPQPGVDYKWDMGDGTIENETHFEHTYNVSNATTDYLITLTATNSNGCTSSMTKMINVVLFIPNIFSPNGDGVNDVFMPDVELEIFNRNGMTLYKGTTGWDGIYNSRKMSDDTYFYALSHKDKNGKVQMKQGYVILKR